MNSLFSVFLKLCVLVIADALVSALTEHSANARRVRAVILAVTVCVLVKGILTLDFSGVSSFSLPETAPDTGEVWNSAAENVSSILEKEIEYYCKNNGLEINGVTVSVKSDGERFETERVTVSGSDAETAKKLIAGHFRIPLAYIIINGDQNE